MASLPEEDASPPGAIASLRALASTLVALVHNRAELAVVELREEGERRKQMLVLGAAAAVFLTLAAGLLAFFVVLVFWDSHRLLAAGGVTLFYLGLGTWALLQLRQKMRDSPPPFEATLAELAKDVQTLKDHDG